MTSLGTQNSSDKHRLGLWLIICLQIRLADLLQPMAGGVTSLGQAGPWMWVGRAS